MIGCVETVYSYPEPEIYQSLSSSQMYHVMNEFSLVQKDGGAKACCDSRRL